MSSKFNRNVSTQDRIIINDPEYLHICSKCKIPKPNKDYSKNNTIRGARKYLASCKKCRSEFYSAEGKEAMVRSAKKQRKKHRLNTIYLSAKNNAKKKGIIFNLTKLDILELWEKQKGLCFYTGKPMYEDITGLDNNNDSVSLDKIIPSNGYIKDNVVLCRWVVNKIKNDLEIKDLIIILQDIKNNLYNVY